MDSYYVNTFKMKNEAICIGDEGKIKITVLDVRGNQVRFGIIAPKEISVHREEISKKIAEKKLKLIRGMNEAL